MRADDILMAHLNDPQYVMTHSGLELSAGGDGRRLVGVGQKTGPAYRKLVQMDWFSVLTVLPIGAWRSYFLSILAFGLIMYCFCKYMVYIFDMNMNAMRG